MATVIKQENEEAWNEERLQTLEDLLDRLKYIYEEEVEEEADDNEFQDVDDDEYFEPRRPTFDEEQSDDEDALWRGYENNDDPGDDDNGVHPIMQGDLDEEHAQRLYEKNRLAAANHLVSGLAVSALTDPMLSAIIDPALGAASDTLAAITEMYINQPPTENESMYDYLKRNGLKALATLVGYGSSAAIATAAMAGIVPAGYRVINATLAGDSSAVIEAIVSNPIVQFKVMHYIAKVIGWDKIGGVIGEKVQGFLDRQELLQQNVFSKDQRAWLDKHVGKEWVAATWANIVSGFFSTATSAALVHSARKTVSNYSGIMDAAREAYKWTTGALGTVGTSVTSAIGLGTDLGVAAAIGPQVMSEIPSVAAQLGEALPTMAQMQALAFENALKMTPELVLATQSVLPELMPDPETMTPEQLAALMAALKKGAFPEADFPDLSEGYEFYPLLSRYLTVETMANLANGRISYDNAEVVSAMRQAASSMLSSIALLASSKVDALRMATNIGSMLLRFTRPGSYEATAAHWTQYILNTLDPNKLMPDIGKEKMSEIVSRAVVRGLLTPASWQAAVTRAVEEILVGEKLATIADPVATPMIMEISKRLSELFSSRK